MKTFMVADKEGERTIEAEQLATFAHYIQQVQFRFVVTKVPGQALPVVTHRGSGKKVCDVTYTALTGSRGDHVAAGRAALEHLIQKAGAARVRSVLAGA